MWPCVNSGGGHPTVTRFPQNLLKSRKAIENPNIFSPLLATPTFLPLAGDVNQERRDLLPVRRSIILPGMLPRVEIRSRDCPAFRTGMAIARAILVLAGILVFAWPERGWSLDRAQATELCRAYLVRGDKSERQQIVKQLAEYQGPIQPIVDRLAAGSYAKVEPGYHPEEHFSTPDLRKKHSSDLLYFVVPKEYRPDRPTGLIVFLHGGGKTTSPRAPQATLRFPDRNASSHASGDMFAATGMITVGPSSPNKPSYHRWCLEEADDYLTDVILECKRRFNIDTNRVFLLGHSMGGFGAYHHALRQPDRFAAVVVNSGSWNMAYWPALRGTPLCIVNGLHDAHQDTGDGKGHRWHYTDVQYGRLTDQILARRQLDHVYLEHDGGHGFSFGRKYVFEYFRSARDLRRDPFFDHVGLASPAGFREAYCYPVQHNRWLSLNEAVKGSLEYDELIEHYSIEHGMRNFASWRLEYRQGKHRGALLDAVNRHDNTIVVSTRNVARFTVWLHPRMVDVSRPVTIMVDGKIGFQGRITPSLVTMLESYERRYDWGLVYPMKVVVDLR